MTDIEILELMIRTEARVPVQKDPNGKTFVELRDAQAPDSRVTVNGIPEDAIVIKTDAFPAPDKVFTGANDECKRSDYLIIAETSRNTYVVHIEMKRTKDPQHEIISQLKGSACFFRYCQEIGVEFYLQKEFLKSAKERFISFGYTGMNKRQTRVTPQFGIHDRPDKLLKIDAPHYLYFDKLVGNWPQTLGRVNPL